MLRESDEKERVGERERECVCVGEGEKERDMDAKNMSLFWHSWRWRCVTWESASSVSYFSQLLLLLMLLLRDKIKKKLSQRTKLKCSINRPVHLNCKLFFEIWNFYFRDSYNGRRRLGGTITITELDLSLWNVAAFSNMSERDHISHVFIWAVRLNSKRTDKWSITLFSHTEADAIALKLSLPLSQTIYLSSFSFGHDVQINCVCFYYQ